jgi:hypothetical protein
MWIKQVRDALLADRRHHRNLRGVQIGQRGPNPTGPRNYAADAEAEVVGALVAHDLERQAGCAAALDRGRPVRVDQALGQCRQKARRRWPETDTGDVDLESLTIRNTHAVHAG